MAIPNSGKKTFRVIKYLLASFSFLTASLFSCTHSFCHTGLSLKALDGPSVIDNGERWSTPVSLSGVGDYLRSLFSSGFPSSLYVLDEYLYNGGDSEKLTLPIEPGTSSGDLISGRELVGASFGYGVSRLFRIEGTALFNPYKSRVFLSPLVKYSVKRDLDIAAGIQVFSAGSDDTDRGSLPNLYFAELKLLF